MRKLLFWLFALIMVSVSVFSQPSNNPIFPTKLEFVELVDRVNSIEKQTPSIDVAGTDYFFGDSGKVFLQLSESGVAVNNASCVLSIYYPDNSLFVNNSGMLPIGEGLQFYNFVVPNISGVYMISASCQYFKSEKWFFFYKVFLLSTLFPLSLQT